MSDNEVDRVAKALAASFRETVALVSGASWEETGVTLPSKEVFERYADAAIGALRRDNVDWAGLFQRYAEHVLDMEGANFLDTFAGHCVGAELDAVTALSRDIERRARALVAGLPE